MRVSSFKLLIYDETIILFTNQIKNEIFCAGWLVFNAQIVVCRRPRTQNIRANRARFAAMRTFVRHSKLNHAGLNDYFRARRNILIRWPLDKMPSRVDIDRYGSVTWRDKRARKACAAAPKSEIRGGHVIKKIMDFLSCDIKRSIFSSQNVHIR
jgi:hypothetical protein